LRSFLVLVACATATPVGATPASPAATIRTILQDPATTCLPPAPATPSPTPASDDFAFVDPTPTLAPDPDAVVDPLLDPMAATAAANLVACWQAGDWEAVAAIVTPRFLQTALGIDAPDAAGRVNALAALNPPPIHIETIGPVAIWNDGRGAVEVFYRRGRERPVQAIAARWFLIAERGIVRFDQETLLLPPPLGDRITVGFSIPDDQQPLRWASVESGQLPTSPVTVLHGANRGRAPHTFLLGDDRGQTIGLLTLPAWQQGDLVLLDLPPGTYRLFDPAVVGSELSLIVRQE
jgi:hypothetical protein